MNYRPEIDGLRALSILSVVFFHAGFDFFSGGYLGVDVFFVISGYLISSIIISDLKNKKFSIVYFYERRARRIIPALTMVIIFCLPFSYYLMLPSQLKDFSSSLISVSLFVSNFYFWINSGYFSVESDFQPLLHTWSLSVEEQFYIFFPLFLIVVWKKCNNKLINIMLIFFIISFMLSEWAWRNAPSAAFYFSPTRAWELLAGVISALFILKNKPVASDLKSLLGILMLVFSIVIFNRNTPMPSFYGLVPILGTVLIVIYTDKYTIVGKVLSCRIFVSIGLISYSVYLWHQPIFAFFRMYKLNSVSYVDMMLMSILSFLIGYVSWRYVELPFRVRGFFSKKVIFIFSLLSLLMICLSGLILKKIENFRYENYRNILNYVNFSQTEEFKSDWMLGVCYIESGTNVWGDFNENKCVNFKENSKKNVVLVGDSHAAHLIKPLLSRGDINLSVLSSSGCRPFMTSDVSDNKECVKRNEYLFDHFIPDNKDKIDILILSSVWHKYEIDKINNVLDFLNDKGIEFVFISGAPQFKISVPQLIINNNIGYSGKGFVEKVWLTWKEELASDNYLKSKLKMKGGVYLSPYDFFCKDKCLVIENGVPMFFDDSHFTPLAAQTFVDNVLGPYLSESNLTR